MSFETEAKELEIKRLKLVQEQVASGIIRRGVMWGKDVDEKRPSPTQTQSNNKSD